MLKALYDMYKDHNKYNKDFNTKIDLCDHINVNYTTYMSTLYDDSMWRFGNEMYNAYGKYDKIFRHKYDRIGFSTMYNRAEPLELLLSSLFDISYVSFKDILSCIDYKNYNGDSILKDEMIKIRACTNMASYACNKAILDDIIKSVEQVVYKAFELKDIIKLFVDKFIRLYPTTGNYLDDRCIDMNQKIEELQYISCVNAMPTEFFTWAREQGFPLSDDVSKWLASVPEGHTEKLLGIKKKVDLCDFIKIVEPREKTILANDTMWNFGEKMYYSYGVYNKIARHENNNDFSLTYSKAENLEKLISSLFNLSHESMQDILSCIDYRSYKDGYMMMHEMIEIRSCNNMEDYIREKFTFDKKIKFIEQIVYDSVELKSIIKLFLEKFIALYKETGCYIDDRRVDMKQDIDVLNYINSVNVNPVEFFTWTLAQNFSLPQDVLEWLKKSIAVQFQIFHCANHVDIDSSAKAELPTQTAEEVLPQSQNTKQVNIDSSAKAEFPIQAVTDVVSPNQTELQLGTIKKEGMYQILSSKTDKEFKEFVKVVILGLLATLDRKDPDWKTLQVGLLGLCGAGHGTIVNEHGKTLCVTSIKAARTERARFIPYMMNYLGIDTSSFFPDDPAEESKKQKARLKTNKGSKSSTSTK